MKILAVSGSARALSTNTAMLRSISSVFKEDHEIEVYDKIASLPIFTPDREGEDLPEAVQQFVALVKTSDALIMSAPEYVHAIPGGLKNAIDWLVSRSEIVGKPIAILHGSHRGDDMLAQLRLVLSTVSDQFSTEAFLRIDLLGLSPEQVHAKITRPLHVQQLRNFLSSMNRNQ